MSAPSPVERAVRELALAQARGLARAGRYTEATELLNGGGPPGAAALDLLARIHAQQGQLDQADRRWAEAERLAPGNQEIARGRYRVAKIRSDIRRPAWGTARRITAAAVVLAAGVAATHVADARSRPPATVRPSSPSARPLLDQVNLRLPGIRVQRRPGEISVAFDRGVFDHGFVLAGGARTLLGELGARLRPFAPEIVVTVIGHTDDLPTPRTGDYTSNAELATLRADVVREILAAAAGIPTARIPVSGMASALAPYPGGDPRDRTVTLRISPTPIGLNG